MEVYLDNSATTRCYDNVRELVGKVMCADALQILVGICESTTPCFNTGRMTTRCDGIYRILLDDFEGDMDAKYVSGELLAELLGKDECFQQVELIDDEIFIVLSQEMCMAEGAKGMSVSM
jgi:hypothetical protein